MIHAYALCTGAIELDRASMVADLAPGQRWTVPVLSFLVDHPRGRLLFEVGDDVVPQLAKLSLATLRTLRDHGGATMFYGHDPAQWAATPRGPEPVI